MNYRFDIQYDGTRYGGWQRQKTTDNTIQGKIEEVLFRMTGSPVPIQGAGRTDAGVHALGQVANGRFDSRLNCEEICDYMNHYLPEDIEILRVSQVSERFHSRLNAKKSCTDTGSESAAIKMYLRESISVLFMRHMMWKLWRRPQDILQELMISGASAPIKK